MTLGRIDIFWHGSDGSHFFSGREATDTGRILATSDEELGKIGPVPSGCGENRGPQRQVFVAGVEIRPYFILALGGGPATDCGLGFVWPDFRWQRCRPGSVSRPLVGAQEPLGIAWGKNA